MNDSISMISTDTVDVKRSRASPDYSVSEYLVELEWNSTNKKFSSEDPTHPKTLCESLGNLMRNGELCDINVILENGHSIPLHSCVLAAISPVLYNHLKKFSRTNNLRISSLPNLSELHKNALEDEDTVRNILQNFAYFGYLQLDTTNSGNGELNVDSFGINSKMKREIQLLAGSMALQIDGAVVIVMEYLKTFLDIASCIPIFISAWQLGCVELETIAESFIDIEFSKVVLEQSWVDAPDAIVARILCRDELNAKDEIEVFRALARWGEENLITRTESLREMLTNPMICRARFLRDDQLEEILKEELLIAIVPNVFSNEFVNRSNNDGDTLTPPRHFTSSTQGSSQVSSMVVVPVSPKQLKRGRSASVIIEPTFKEGSAEIFSNVRVLHGHENGVCGLAVLDNWVVSGSADHTIRVWDIATGKGERVLRGHSDSVSALKFFNNHLVSGSFDRSIRIWSLSDWEFRGFVSEFSHDEPITCLTVITKNHQLASGSAGGEIKIWSPPDELTQDPNCEWTLIFILQNAHAHVLWSCCEWGSTIVTGSSDKEIRVWDSTSWLLVRKIVFHKDEVQALLVVGDELYSGSDDGIIAVHSAIENVKIRSKEVHRPVLAFACYDNFLVVGCGDGGVLLLSLTDLSFCAELKGHSASVMTLVTNKRSLITGSFDQTVRIWEN